ncbi:MULTISPECIES: amino acid ABC transporter permease [Brevibacillus]|jgi:His/Glu/Gln/Arg/opine family amino acid ABC transporter permease subunit|uniref:Arginine transport system permease protein ArtQ n=1 Tax=Brevibacillus parabrevis TaxID=54914 RepID=A0A4Y3PKX2_BREPA|nr:MULTISPECIES: amino acid ABC transporter permease [Brevibacillus]MBU8711557.1 amino acid ABC transporter permease [Brevibacillus parabrevis]MDH6349815.1 His/Glu/Gln/Arg/opine family amino acid ABC transporter permease subunit [Brevibacillus sp. 1238]MDR4999267.1 amino acid ABC transporter permease [Brevibacillus parabrevis]MED1721858.1 amino acid ABC transporter permease [Brevibacillus parabrevis]MED2254173.1 amino acid ABC transporter permease [Brevibacillus parabrevis]
MNLDFAQIVPYIPFILQGIKGTLLVTLISVVLGFVWGSILALIKISKFGPLNWLAIAYTSVFRGTPLILQLTFVYFATPQLTGYNISQLEAAVLTFTLNSGAYISETIRGGIMAVDKGQWEAAKALGIPYRRMMLDIILPQGIKNILPALVNETIALLKESALVSTIGLSDIMQNANVVKGAIFRYFEPYIIAGTLYYVMVMMLTWVARVVERRMRRSD